MEIIYTLALLGIVIALAGILKEKKSAFKKSYQYQKKNSLMTDAEKNFYRALQSIVGGKYEIFPQVHLSALLDHKVNGQNWRGALSHIHQKSVDFVLCEKESILPVLAIELNDKSHERPLRAERDRVVSDIFATAGIPLLFIKNQVTYNSEELDQQIAIALLANKNVV